MKTLWRPHEGQQTLALQVDDVFELLYGGARGGGVSGGGARGGGATSEMLTASKRAPMPVAAKRGGKP